MKEIVEPHGQSPWHHTRRPSGATSRPNAGAFIHGHPAQGRTAAGVKIVFILLGEVVLLLHGCAGIGPGKVARDRFDYNTALSDS